MINNVGSNQPSQLGFEPLGIASTQKNNPIVPDRPSSASASSKMDSTLNMLRDGNNSLGFKSDWSNAGGNIQSGMQEANPPNFLESGLQMLEKAGSFLSRTSSALSSITSAITSPLYSLGSLASAITSPFMSMFNMARSFIPFIGK